MTPCSMQMWNHNGAVTGKLSKQAKCQFTAETGSEVAEVMSPGFAREYAASGG